jgi:hypothetical protein
VFALSVVPVICLAAKFRQEAGDFLTLVSAVTPRSNSVCLYSSVVTPAPQGVRMDMKKPGYFPDRQHVTHMFTICHVFPYILFD